MLPPANEHEIGNIKLKIRLKPGNLLKLLKLNYEFNLLWTLHDINFGMAFAFIFTMGPIEL